MNTPAFAYEIVFGHRRHRACLELGLLVVTLVKDLTEQELFEQMDRENRQRKDLTAYEQGEMYRHALDEGLYPSMRKLSESLGVAWRCPRLGYDDRWPSAKSSCIQRAQLQKA